MNKEDIQQIAELMEAQLASIKTDIAGMKGDIAPLKDDIRQTRVLVEQQRHQIRLLAEQYTDIAKKLDKVNERAA